jgi:hypothetical protein
MGFYTGKKCVRLAQPAASRFWILILFLAKFGSGV